MKKQLLLGVIFVAGASELSAVISLSDQTARTKSITMPRTRRGDFALQKTSPEHQELETADAFVDYNPSL